MTGRTALLVAIIIATLIIHYLPVAAPVIWIVAVVGGATWVLRTGLIYYRYHRRIAERDAQRRDDAAEYLRYEQELGALRADATLTADEFERQAAALQDRYRVMLTRRFGPH